MDGRRFRRWCLVGGLLAGAVGCNRNNYHDNFGMPKPGQTVGALKPGGGMGMKPGAAPAGLTTGSTPGIAGPVDKVMAAKKPGKGLQPETEAMMAEVHVAAALADPPPTNRDELLDMARQRYQRALKADPKNPAALLGLARMYARLGERDKAMDVYKKYAALYPKDHQVLHELAIVHGQWRDWNGAVAWCEAALKSDPENRAYRKTMGFCQARAGRWDDAFVTLMKVMPEPQARYSMARVMEHLNYTDASRQQLQMALTADPAFAPARDFLAELDAPPGQPMTVPGNPDPNAVQRAGYNPQPGQ